MPIRALSIFLIVVGGLGFLFPIIKGLFPSHYFPIQQIADEVPSTYAVDAAASADGHVFIALMFWGRVQEYSPSGAFVRGFDVNSSGGLFCLDISDGHLFVDVARRDKADEFDLAGKLVKTDLPRRQARGVGSCEFDPAIVGVKQTLTETRVIFSEGRAPIVIQRQAWHYLALHPFASWAMFVFGLLLWPEWRRRVMQRLLGRKN